MSKVKVQQPVIHLPSFKEYKISNNDLALAIPHDRIWQGVRLFDGNYFYVCHEDWGKILADVLLNMPKYVVDRFECDDYALVVKARVVEKYKLNAFAMVTGYSPMGDHAWNWFYDELGWHQLEPQTGDVGSVDSDGYVAKWLII